MTARGTSTQRGYGYVHQRARANALRNLEPGTPCPFCGQPMFSDQALDYDHETPRALGGQGPRRLAHAVCNRRAGGVLGNIRRGRRVVMVKDPPLATSRAW